MSRKPFNLEIDLYSGPGFGLAPTFIGRFDACLIRQLPIQTIGVGAVQLPYWMTIDMIRPTGAWTLNGFGMDARFADQVAYPPGTPPKWWILYTDEVIYGALTPYFRAYLSPLPLPSQNVPTWNARLHLLMPEMSPTPPTLVLSGNTRRVSSLAFDPMHCVRRGGPAFLSNVIVPRAILQMRPIVQGSNIKIRSSARNGNLRWRFDIVRSVDKIQSAKNVTVGGSTSCTWPVSTQTGSLLVMVVTNSTLTQGANPPSITVPSGWTFGGSSIKQLSAQAAAVFLYYKTNAPSQSGTVIASSNWPAGSPYPNVIGNFLFEFSPLTQNGIADGFQSNTGSMTGTLTTGTTGATSVIPEIGIAAYCQQIQITTGTFSSPTNGYTIDQQGTQTAGIAGVAIKSLDTLATTSSGVTSSQTMGNWAALIATFK